MRALTLFPILWVSGILTPLTPLALSAPDSTTLTVQGETSAMELRYRNHPFNAQTPPSLDAWYVSFAREVEEAAQRTFPHIPACQQGRNQNFSGLSIAVDLTPQSSEVLKATIAQKDTFRVWDYVGCQTYKIKLDKASGANCFKVLLLEVDTCKTEWED
jgi:hypothetical protein